jgi:HPr kinase/phosphorylase
MTGSPGPLPPAIHASCVIIGTLGLLIRGRSGAGKSVLSDLLVDAAAARGHFAAHVSDDRTYLIARGDLLVASPPPAIAGKHEVRGLGIMGLSHEPEAIVHLVADLKPSEAVERYPEEALAVRLEGLTIPLVQLAEGKNLENLNRLRWKIRSLFPKCPAYI